MLSKNKIVIIPKIKPNWPNNLPNLNLDVVKINSVGSRMRRQIKLTEHFIINIQNNTLISKVHHYLDISKIWIEDDNLIVLVLKKDNEKIIYLSHIAGYIVQQITTRIYFRKLYNSKTSFYSLPIDYINKNNNNNSNSNNNINNNNINKTYLNPHVNAKLILDIQMEIDKIMIEFINEFSILLSSRYEKGIYYLIL
jgi:hypothetical protein